MILALSESDTLISKLHKLCVNEGIFFIRNANDLPDESEISISLVIADACEIPKVRLRRFTRILYEEHTDTPCYFILSDQASLLGLSASISDNCLTDDNLLDLLKKYSESKRINSFVLKISKNRKDTLLLGYPLLLSPSEHRILLLLSRYPEVNFTAKNISDIAFLPKKEKNSVAVHICAINKKASRISGRPLIISEYGRGYKINSRM